MLPEGKDFQKEPPSCNNRLFQSQQTKDRYLPPLETR